MKIDFTFKRSKKSENVEAYAREKCHKLEKYELKPRRAEFIITAQRGQPKVEMIVHGNSKRLVAKASGPNLFKAIDNAIAKIDRQMGKNKEIVQKHKKPHMTKEHKLSEALNESLEIDFSKTNKTRKQAA